MRKNILISVFLLFSLVLTSYSQPAIIGGLNFGGPIPEKISENSTGKPVIGMHLGFSYVYKLSDKFSLTPEIYYAFKGVDYGQSFTKDTLVPITILGVPGEVPSFYTADVNGSMRLHSIDIPLLFSYNIGKVRFSLGPYFSFLVGGKDKGNVRVVLGEGGFYDDYTEAYDNSKNIRILETGIMGGINVLIYKGLFAEMRFSRSLTTLYKSDAPSRGEGSNKMYNTFVQFSLGYSFIKKK